MSTIESYYTWLFLTVEHPFISYNKLIRILFETRFFAILSNDQNRMGDVEDLRLLFRYETRNTEDLSSRYISVLEVIITLSQRMYQIAYDPDESNSPQTWFWKMIENLGLIDFEDDNCGGLQEAHIRETLSVFVRREYEENGSGGLFPLDYPEKDQRDVELWYQMQSYMDAYV